MTISWLDDCKFTAASGGTADFVVAAAVSGYQTPAGANAVNGATYRYRAESVDLTQWELGTGSYTASGTTLARTTVLFSSTGGGKVSFTNPPTVGIVVVAEDVAGFCQTANNLSDLASTATARNNLCPAPQRTVLTSGSGTYNTPAGALYLRVRGKASGSGGAGSGTGAGAGTAGVATTFGSSLLTANGGGAGQPANGSTGGGGTASGGDTNITGDAGASTSGGMTVCAGACGGGEGGGPGGYGIGSSTTPGTGGAGAANTGGGGGGAGANATAGPGGGGGEGGEFDKLITSPLTSYPYAVGGSSAGGAAGTNGAAGGASGSGIIDVWAHFQ
jgi:hypothetical protein